MYKIELNSLFNRIVNSKDVSSFFEEQINVLKKDISELIEKFKYDKIEDDVLNDK